MPEGGGGSVEPKVEGERNRVYLTSIEENSRIIKDDWRYVTDFGSIVKFYP